MQIQNLKCQRPNCPNRPLLKNLGEWLCGECFKKFQEKMEKRNRKIREEIWLEE